VVRIRAAEALAGLPPARLMEMDRQSLAKPGRRRNVVRARPDDHASTIIWELLPRRGQPEESRRGVRDSSRLRPDSVPPLVNASMAYYALGEKENAENRCAAR